MCVYIDDLKEILLQCILKNPNEQCNSTECEYCAECIDNSVVDGLTNNLIDQIKKE